MAGDQVIRNRLQCRTSTVPRLLCFLLTVSLVLGLVGCGDDDEPEAASETTESTDVSIPSDATTAPTTEETTVTSAPAAQPTEVEGTTPEGEAALLGPVYTVPVGDITMSYRQFGAGPELVLVGGQAAPMSLWPVTMLGALSQLFHVTIYDNRSLGLTTDDTSVPLTMEQMADDLVGLVGVLGYEQPNVFGWSTGGEIALVAATRSPESFGPIAVTGAMPGGPSAVPGPEENIALLEDPTTDPLLLLPLLFGDNDQAAQDYVAALSAVEQTEVAPETVERYADAEHAYLDGEDYLPKFAEIPNPMLVLNGEDDQLVPAENAEVIAGAIPGSRLEIFPGGHAWFLEYPGEALGLLVEFYG